MFRWLPSELVIIAHRGASREAPENTLGAFSLALHSAHAVELDAQLTRDGAVVVIHDLRVDRTTDGRGRVRDYAAAELRRLRVCDRAGRITTERIPLLEEVLEAVPHGKGVNVELKYTSVREDPRRLAQAVAKKVLDSGSAGRVLLSSFNHLALEFLRDRHPHISRGFLVRPAALPAGPGIHKALSLGAAAIIYSGANIRKRYAAEARESGLMVLEYTVNSPPRYRRALNMNVDGMITDVPDRLARLARQARMAKSAGQ